ncbi:MAG: chorismate dehydratase [Phycisphaerales bacterium]|nr:MAG: chorismate dehydratase [Phycisphaerales bacterium]
MEPIRIACVEYLNTAPLVAGLDAVEGLTLLPTVPADIGAMVEQGQADLGLASIVDVARAREPLAIVPAGMIGCAGPTLTVRLFSTVPMERIAVLCADADSHTSVVLAQLLLAELYDARPAVVPFDARERVPVGRAPSQPIDQDQEGWPGTLLLIGDKVVTHSPPAVRYPYQMDLGEAWHRHTGLPFVYAAWACRASMLEDPQQRRRLQVAAAMLDRQRRHNATRLDWLARHWAERARWPTDLAQQYLGQLLRYEFGRREAQAVEAFFRMAGERGLLHADPPRIAWLEPPAPMPAQASATGSR